MGDWGKLAAVLGQCWGRAENICPHQMSLLYMISGIMKGPNISMACYTFAECDMSKITGV